LATFRLRPSRLRRSWSNSGTRNILSRFIDAMSAATQDRFKRGAEMLRTRQTYAREGRIRTTWHRCYATLHNSERVRAGRTQGGRDRAGYRDAGVVVAATSKNHLSHLYHEQRNTNAMDNQLIKARIRIWLRERFTRREPPPDIMQVRRAIGWDAVQAASPGMHPIPTHDAVSARPRTPLLKTLNDIAS
jgi:hypothetical protein